MRFRSRWLTVVIAGTLATLPAAAQQQPTPPTHVVKTGDTLWDLSAFYLRDPFLWPEIYRLNTDIVQDPHWIYPGEVLKLPGPMTSSAPVTEAPTGSAPTTFAEQPSGQQQPVSRNTGGSTVFRPASAARTGATGATATTMDAARTGAPAVRPGEYDSAPWVVDGDGIAGSGRFIRSSALPGVAAQSLSRRFQINEEIYVVPPAGALAQKGAHYVSYASGPVIPGVGQIVIPTGVLEVVDAPAGDAALVRIVRQFDEITLDQHLVQPEGLGAMSAARPVPVAQGTPAKVAWVRGSPVLPSLQYYLVLNVTSANGVKPGDQFTLLRLADTTRDGVVVPEQDVAVAEVVRVTPFGTTAILIHLTQPTITAGMPARLTARMP